MEFCFQGFVGTLFHVTKVQDNLSTHLSTADEPKYESTETEQHHQVWGTSAWTQNPGEDIKEGRVDRSDSRELRSKSKGDQHGKEEDCPKGWDRKASDNFWVDNERQTSTCNTMTQ